MQDLYSGASGRAASISRGRQGLHVRLRVRYSGESRGDLRDVREPSGGGRVGRLQRDGLRLRTDRLGQNLHYGHRLRRRGRRDDCRDHTQSHRAPLRRNSVEAEAREGTSSNASGIQGPYSLDSGSTRGQSRSALCLAYFLSR